MLAGDKSGHITMRAVMIGILIMPVNYYWCIIAKEPYQYQSVPISFALLYNVIFIMSVLVGLKSILKKISPKHLLRQSELITIYVILSFTTTVGGMDMMQILPPMMEHTRHFRFIAQ